ncbi:type VI secretion system-associated protein TagF [Jannaschia marina]|uniref:type VI secretion system-associated protein TagF n=1 Tax=Jannaschia marina TaxID=2741674 RepID=UPI0015C7B275|nr:type VI secretion system-associated protein TagF [Jannaschia marina]
MTEAFGWFGKHPAYGDFVSRRVSEPVRDALQDWLDGALGLWRAEVGDDAWRAGFDAAPVVRFWIGALILGQGRSGVMVPARDKVGRRYPLLLLTAGSPVPPPLDPDQAPYDVLAERAAAVLSDPETPAGGDGMPEAVDDILWATNDGAEAGTLLSDIAAEDMCRAAQMRSYWWTVPEPGSAAQVISATGLPDGATLAWLMTGVPLRPDPGETTSDEDRDGHETGQ